MLEALSALAKKDNTVKLELIEARNSKEPYVEFSKVARKYGFELYPMDIIDIGDEYLALLERSVNGGGANHTVLTGSDDFFSQFFNEIEK